MGGCGALAFLAGRSARFALKSLMTDRYAENMAELFSATKRTGIQDIIETNLRAEFGTVIQRPLGSPRRFRDFDSLMFISAHLDRPALPSTTPIDTEVAIGPKAKRPLMLGTPLLISGMAYKRALSAEMKYALARASTEARTATNTGEGPFLPKERELAQNLIVQYPRLPLDRSLEMLQQADAIEIQMGQGATAGAGQGFFPHLAATDLPPIKKPRDLPHIVRFLKKAGRGVPVGIKLSLSDRIERDMELSLRAGVDFFSLDGAQAATVGAPPILEDDFGLPTFVGLCRAAQYLNGRGLQRRVSLIISGGFTSPGQCLKALALGADAVALGTMALFAASHTQTLKALPWEPPTEIAFAKGRYAKKFNWKRGALHLARYLQSSTEEIREGVRALGKHALREVNKYDLVALDEAASDIARVPLAYSKRKTRAGSLLLGK